MSYRIITITQNKKVHLCSLTYKAKNIPYFSYISCRRIVPGQLFCSYNCAVC